MLRKLNIVAANGGSCPNFEPSPFANWPSDFLRAIFFSGHVRRLRETFAAAVRLRLGPSQHA
jgi:hypothetical protein